MMFIMFFVILVFLKNLSFFFLFCSLRRLAHTIATRSHL